MTIVTLKITGPSLSHYKRVGKDVSSTDSEYIGWDRTSLQEILSLASDLKMGSLGRRLSPPTLNFIKIGRPHWGAHTLYTLSTLQHDQQTKIICSSPLTILGKTNGFPQGLRDKGSSLGSCINHSTSNGDPKSYHWDKHKHIVSST